MISKQSIGWFVVIALLSAGTSPIPPYHSYLIEGRIVGPASIDLDSLQVSLLAKLRQDTSFRSVEGSHPGDYPLGVTDSEGRFSLRATSGIKADSLMLRIGNEDTPVRFTAAFVIPDTIATAVKERLPNLDDNPEFLGINCSTDYSIQTVGYEYRWTDGEFPVSGIESTRP